MQYDENHHISIKAKAAGVAIIDELGRILMVKEKLSGKSGLWHIPSGSVEEGESLEVAAKRETKEETGLDVTLIAYLDTYIGRFDDGEYVARHVWIAEIVGNQLIEPELKEEIDECRYFSKSEFDALYKQRKVRMHHTKLIFEDALVIVSNQKY